MFKLVKRSVQYFFPKNNKIEYRSLQQQQQQQLWHNNKKRVNESKIRVNEFFEKKFVSLFFPKLFPIRKSIVCENFCLRDCSFDHRKVKGL